MNQKGQMLIEHSLVLLLILLPLGIGGMHWGVLELKRARCSHLAWTRARSLLITENRTIQHTEDCGSGIIEKVKLLELESPDRMNGGF